MGTFIAASLRRRKCHSNGARLLACLIALAASPRIAHADDAAEAQLHFQLGAMEFRAHHYAEALAHFLAAHRLAPTANTIFNVAQTYLELQREADAYRFFRDYLVHPGATDANRAIANQAIARIEPTLARIEVITDPPGATIFIDRVDVGDVGVTPRTLAVPPGSHEVIVRLAGRGEQRRTADAQIGHATRVELNLALIVGAVHVATSPTAATVLIDGVERGLSPLDASLPPGIHRVIVRRDGYLDVSRELEVRAGQSSTLDERLPVDLTRSGVLSVTSVTPGATVRFRGVVLGATPVNAFAMRPGPGVLDVEQNGMTPLRRSVFLRVGHEQTARVTLGTPGAHRPLWIPALAATGALGVIAGISVGIVAISTHADFNQSPDRATLDRTNTLNVAADLTLLAGVLLLAGGVTSFLLTPDPSQSRAVFGEEVFRAAGR